MAKKRTLITFEGSNEELLVRRNVTNIDMNAEIVVPETHYAICMKDGQLMNTFDSGRYPLFDALSEKKNKTQMVEIIYLSKTVKISAGWGTNKQFTFRDSYTDIPFAFGASGSFEVRIKNPRKFFLEVVGSVNNYSIDDLVERLIDYVTDKVQPILLNIIVEKSIDGHLDYMCVDIYHDEMLQKVKIAVSDMFEREYGLSLSAFSFKFFIPENFKNAIEAERKKINERKAEEELLKKKEEKERIEKLENQEKDDKDWERTKFLLELRKKDYEKYLEVCKIIGWEAQGRICPNCGYSYKLTERFCPNCGKSTKNIKIKCLACGHENEQSARFCSFCGKKLEGEQK